MNIDILSNKIENIFNKHKIPSLSVIITNKNKNIFEQYSSKAIDEDFLMKVYDEYLSDRELCELVKEILIENLSKIQKMKEIDKPE